MYAKGRKNKDREKETVIVLNGAQKREIDWGYNAVIEWKREREGRKLIHSHMQPLHLPVIYLPGLLSSPKLFASRMNRTKVPQRYFHA